MIQMRLYTLSRYHISVIYTIFISIFIGTVTVSSRISSSSSTTVNASSIDPTTDLSKGPFLLRSPTVTSFNQELWIQGKIKLQVPKNFTGLNFKQFLYIIYDPKYDPEKMTSKYGPKYDSKIWPQNTTQNMTPKYDF